MQPHGDGDRFIDVPNVFQQHREFVAAHSSNNRVGFAKRGIQSRGDADQEVIARIVTEVIVDQFKIIDVHEDDGESVLRIASLMVHASLHSIVEQHPVGKPRQRVGNFAFGDVGQRTGNSIGGAV